jgi:hypothetical protein
MTTSTHTGVAPTRPKATAGTPRGSAAGSGSRAGLTADESAELQRLRAEKLELQARINDLNLQLTLVKAAAALFVGERGRPGHGSIAAPEVA